MRREFHVRFCEGGGVRFPSATRRNVYVKSWRAGQRVLHSLREMYARLRLRLNEEKSAVDRPWNWQFLGYSCWVAVRRKMKRRLAPRR